MWCYGGCDVDLLSCNHFRSLYPEQRPFLQCLDTVIASTQKYELSWWCCATLRCNALCCLLYFVHESPLQGCKVRQPAYLVMNTALLQQHHSGGTAVILTCH